MSTQDLTETIRVGAGELRERELAEFCGAHHRRLVGLLALYTGDRSLAEELAQEAFVRACRDWSKVRRMDNPAAWLNTVAMNLANSSWRRRAAERRARRRHGVDVVPGQDPSTTVAIRQAVAALPRRQRSAVVLRFYVGMSVAETAHVMGCAEGTVKSLTNRAMTALRAQNIVEKEPRDDH